ncbi:TonB-dependent receptor [Asticcacaulis sp. EMRT-3]|uniref:TonB-dependent receptor n=1 Tax=Asticcacaulis sp. EMRT-3 TaxID=3040349 RepID=UPI0024AEB080|nr:TonB-dependent receptor [Asticcacaulis sp. EMRT-3]MDI7776081.1 TonB-dependent receptor [Asticcacaulis sp. EMRT-3]
MRSINGKVRFGPNLLKAGVSAMALTAMAAGAAVPAFAQDGAPAAAAPTGAATEVVVVGVRRSLQSAQQIKKNADTIVDSITATDIGSFPDKSVAEALQRVAGITVSRFAATTDTAHFSAEPSGVLVRGLSQVRSEFNGRDTFSANSSRGLSWGDVSPELMAGVDAYKNETADMIEGGIAGTINLRTRLPFDQKGRLLAFSADMAYNDLSKATTPDFSGIYANRWDTSIGEFGVMLNAAYSKVETRSQGSQLFRDGIFCAPGGTATIDPASGNVPANAGCNTPLFPGASGYEYIPTRDTQNDATYNRTRHGVAFAAQWQNHSHSLLATFQYNDTNYDNEMTEHRLMAQFYSSYNSPVSTVFDNTTGNAPLLLPATGTDPFVFDDQGIFQSGTPSGPYYNSSGSGLFSDNTGKTLLAGCSNWNGTGSPTQAECGRMGTVLNTITRYSDNQEKTQDASFNLKWNPNDKLRLNFDVQYVNSTVKNYDMEASLQTWANTTLNMNGPGGHPTMSFASPENIAFADGGDLTNPGDYHYDYLMDHSEDSAGHEFATRLDAEYLFGGGWLNSLRVGVRYSDREQDIRWSTYNWSSISDGIWSNAPTDPVLDGNGNVLTAGSAGNNLYHQLTSNYAVTSAIYPQNIYSVQSFGTSIMGNNLLSSNNFVWLNTNIVKNQAALAAALGAPALGWTDKDSPTGYEGWVPVCERINDLPGTCYTPSETNHVAEKTQAVYAMLKFGGNDQTIGTMTVDGNVGLRWVQTEDDSRGYLQFPTSPSIGACKDPTNPANPPASQQVGCLAGTPGATNINAAVAFSNNGYTATNTDKTHINFLPSFNLRLGLTDQWFLRFAASRAMSRPDMGYLKSYISLGSPSWDQTCNVAANCIKNGSGQTVDMIPTLTATGGNPNLKPITADQFDISLEDYFASAGSFTFDLFYKKFYDYIQLGQLNETFTNNGVSENVKLQAPLNFPGATVKGFEVAYQRFFDFLPSPWNGLGIQANYTHIHNTGVNNSTLNPTNAGSPIPQNSSSGVGNYDSINPHSLEGLSDDAYNVIGMYEKGPWALRLAYNWRSKYLVTALDCCVGLPVWQRAQGVLDGSIRYKVNDNIEINLEGSNLTSPETVILQQVSGDFTGDNPNAKRVFAPDGWFKSDRRIELGVRFKY